MLYWLKLFIFFFFCTAFSLALINNSILMLLFHSELLIIILFFTFLLLASFYNLSFLIGLSLCYLIFGGMELALNLLLLIF